MTSHPVSQEAGGGGGLIKLTTKKKEVYLYLYPRYVNGSNLNVPNIIWSNTRQSLCVGTIMTPLTVRQEAGGGGNKANHREKELCLHPKIYKT
jgi:hypothetical protein